MIVLGFRHGLQGKHMIEPNEIADVANRVRDLLVRAEPRSKRADRDRLIGEALGLSCDLLTRLCDTDIVVRYDEVVAEGNREASIALRDSQGLAVEFVSMSPERFNLFLTRETTLLAQSGFNDVLISLLTYRIREAFDALRNDQPSAELLDKALSQMRDHVCAQRDLLARRLRQRGPARALLLAIGGIGLISVNIASAPSLGIIGAGASATIGSGLIGDSVRIISEAL